MVRVTIGSEQFDIDLSDLTAIDSRDFNHAVGVSLEAVLAGQHDGGYFVFAGLKWLHDRRTNPKASFDEIAKAITFGMEVDIAATPADEEQVPEA